MDRVSYAWKSDKGRRSANEDACLIVPGEELNGLADGLFVVADGMGGRASGAIASSMAVKAVRDAFLYQSDGMDIAESLVRSLQAANDAVFREANSKPELQGMGTTCATAAIRDDRLHFAHLGDSRIYLLREGRLSRLTEDHSFVAEKVRSGEISEEHARKSRFRNVITRAVGLEPHASPESGSIDLHAGDVILLCTDGLCGPVADSEIEDILCSSSDAKEACDRLISSALSNGGSDNITSAVVTFGRKPVGVKSVGNKKASWALPLLLGLVLGTAVGLGGRPYLAQWIAAPEQEQVEMQIDREMEYEEPVSLLYLPLKGDFLALDTNGFLYAADHQGRILQLDDSGRVMHAYPRLSAFEDAEQFRVPVPAVDSYGNIYISDTSNGRILKFDPEGKLIQEIGGLSSPEALIVNADGHIYVIDDSRLKIIRRPF